MLSSVWSSRDQIVLTFVLATNLKDTSEKEIVPMLLEFFIALKKQGVVKVRIEPDRENDSFSYLETYGPGATPETPELIERREISAEHGQAVSKCIIARSYNWPQRGGNFDSHNIVDEQKRILFAPFLDFRLIADVRSSRLAGTKKHRVSLDNITWEGITPLLEQINIGATHRTMLNEALRQKNGLILCNRSHDDDLPGTIDGTALIVAMRPDALVFSLEELAEAVSLAATNLVIVEAPREDPVDMTLEFRGLLEQRTSISVEESCRSLLLAIVHKRVRRTCNSCKKPTPVTTDILKKLPTVLQEAAPKEYLFGRGCTACNNTTYLGSVGIESVIPLYEHGIQSLLITNASRNDFIGECYPLGTRSLIERGLETVYEGFSSFEEVLGASPRLNSGFKSAIEGESTTRSAPKITNITARISEPSPPPQATNSTKNCCRKWSK